MGLFCVLLHESYHSALGILLKRLWRGYIYELRTSCNFLHKVGVYYAQDFLKHTSVYYYLHTTKKINVSNSDVLKFLSFMEVAYYSLKAIHKYKIVCIIN